MSKSTDFRDAMLNTENPFLEDTYDDTPAPSHEDRLAAERAPYEAARSDQQTKTPPGPYKGFPRLGPYAQGFLGDSVEGSQRGRENHALRGERNGKIYPRLAGS